MVGRVLTGNGITRYGDGLYSLIGAEELSASERDALLQLCRQRLDGFREQRGEEVFAHRSRHRSPISGSVKVRGFTRARGRWESRAAMLLIRNGGTPRRCLQASRRRDVSRSGP
jgi:ATP adenylyltransferase